MTIPPPAAEFPLHGACPRLLRSLVMALAVILGLIAAHGAPEHPVLPFDSLTLIDQIDCGNPATPHLFEDFPTGISQIQNILGRDVRTIPNAPGSDTRYFAYRIGQGKGLQAGKAYVLEIDYPEDAPRAMFIYNNGATITRGIRTGPTLGDGINIPFVSSNPESLDIPLAGTYRTWRNFFHLHDRFSGIERLRGSGERTLVPADGFWVIIAQFSHSKDPLSNGAAAASIRLYEAPEIAEYTAPLNLPPDGLPHRHVFFREEMADGAAIGELSRPLEQGVHDPVDWHKYRARQMKFLGINTFTVDLLEFGSNQGFDSGPGGGANWYIMTRDPDRWERVLRMVAGYDLSVLPYYEYSGSRGPSGLGGERRAKPLNFPSLTAYTHITWAESNRANLADPDTIEDAKLLLDVTMTRFKNEVPFIGAWFRARVSQMPISFADEDFVRYANEKNGGVPITRKQVQDSATLRKAYIDWWFEKRKVFIDSLRNHLRDQGFGKDATMLFTSDASESGRTHIPSGQHALIAETPSLYSAIGVNATSFANAIAAKKHEKALTLPTSNWGSWEWHHADPQNDPLNYQNDEGSLLTYSFNRAYTVSDPATLDLFRTQSGLAMIRHFCLNEDAMSINHATPSQTDPLGYFVSDTEYTGPYIMMPEALAVANGDPRYIGYLSGGRYSPGSPEYVRAFNQAFLSLPALPSTVLTGAASDSAVVVREIETDGYGTYLAVVNTSRTDKAVTITLPHRGIVKDLVSGDTLATGTTISIEMYPFQLRALHIDKVTLDGAVAADDAVSTPEGIAIDIDVLANDSGTALSLGQLGTPRNGTVSIVNGKVRYTPNPGFFGSDSFSYTVTNGVDDDAARVNITVENTATTNNLAGWGLNSTPVGNFVDGRSRILSDGLTAELAGAAQGLEGTTDSVYFESRPVFGDFVMTARISDVSALGDGMAGLMVRQDLSAGARLVSLGHNSNGIVTFQSREANRGASTLGTSATSGNWLRIERVGNVLTYFVSADNVTYTPIGFRVQPGLPDKLEVGLFITSGGRTQARAHITDLDINTSSGSVHNIFLQEFNSSSNVADYVSAAPGQHQLNDISAEANGGTWSIDRGTFLLTRPVSASPDNGAGFTRLTPFATTPQLVRMSFDLGVSGNNNSFSTVAALSLGDVTGITDYSGDTSHARKVFDLTIVGGGGGSFRLRHGAVTTPSLIASGVMYSVTVFLNNSGVTQTYEGLDGNSYSVSHRNASVWVNGELLVDNIPSPGTYTCPDIKNIRFRVSTNEPMSFRFDNILIADTFGASTPSIPNTAPVAVSDSGTLNEGTSLLVPVLANDSDPDNGPSGLTITSAANPAHGAVQIIGRSIRYTPAIGYYGSDSFTYTISDGKDTATGNVSLTVNNTALFSDLSQGGLTGLSLNASGASRVLANGKWELRSNGSGVAGSSDHVHFEHEPVSGNFTAYARVNHVYAAGATPLVGLMVRESLSENGRMGILAATDETTYQYAARASVAGNATILSGTGDTGTYRFPGAWIMIERKGDTLFFASSEDGVYFDLIESASLPGLAKDLHVGLFSASAIGIVTDYAVIPEQKELFKQTFDSPNLSDYINDVTTGRNQFNDISAEAEGGTWSIDDGKLKLVRTASSSPNNGTGFTRLVDWPDENGVLKVSLDFSLNGVVGFGEIASIDVGRWDALVDYNGASPHSKMAGTLAIRANGTNVFRFATGSVQSGNLAANGAPMRITWFVNTSGSTQTYHGPDGNDHTVAHNATSVWMDDTLIFDSVARATGYSSSRLTNIRFRSGASAAVTYTIDNLVVENTFVENTAPVATNDTAMLDEGVPTLINVLANDTDPDAGPSALAIYSYGQPTHGTVTQSGSQLLYTPNPGFYGSDSFVYLVTDGLEEDWGLVSLTVNSTSLANNLELVANLYGETIGTGSTGSSRVLATGDWEINGSGSGLSGSSDSFHIEGNEFDGDFALVTRVSSLSSASADALAGLTLRESLDANARMVAIGINPLGELVLVERTATATAASQSKPPFSFIPPDHWIMLVREGDDITLLASDNGEDYEEIATVTLSGLPNTVHAGLFSSSGATGQSARAVVTGFDATPIPSAIFFQDFSSSNVVNDYVHATAPGAGDFNDISADVNAGTWSISGGRLSITRPGLSGSNGAGITRHTDVAGATGLVCMEFDISATSFNAFSDLINVVVGNVTSTTSYTGTHPYVNTAFSLNIRAFGNQNMVFQLEGINSGGFTPNGTDIHIAWYMNTTGSTQSYKGPDGNTYTLNDLSSSVWINNQLVHNNIARFVNFGHRSLADFRIRLANAVATTVTFDNIEIWNVPPL